MSRKNPPRRSGTEPFERPRAILAGIGVYAVLAAAVLWVGEGLPTAVRIPIALPLLLFVPGYAVLAGLFPLGRDSGVKRLAPHDRKKLRLSSIERVVVAVVASIAIVPGIAVVANVIVGVALEPVLVGIVVVTALGSGVGFYRLPPGAADVPLQSHGTSSRDSLATRVREAMADPVTVVAIVLCVMLLMSSAALAFVGTSGDPSPGTEFYVTNNEGEEANATGEAAGGYALRIAQDGVASQRYTVVVKVNRPGDNSSTQTSRELDRFPVTVAAGETVAETYQAPTSVDSDTTLYFLLYRDDAPPTADPDTAHRVLRFSIGTA